MGINGAVTVRYCEVCLRTIVKGRIQQVDVIRFVKVHAVVISSISVKEHLTQRTDSAFSPDSSSHALYGLVKVTSPNRAMLTVSR